MVGNGLIALVLAIGCAGWIYTKLSRNSGGNAKNAAIGALVAGACIFMVAIFILGMISK